MRALPSLTILVSLALTSCDADPVAPMAREYLLVSIGFRPLPAHPSDDPNRLLAESILTFTSSGRGEERALTLVRDSDDPAGRLIAATRTFRYQVAEDWIEITFDCLEPESCIAPPHLAGRRVGSTLRFDQTPGRAPYRYQAR
ncbi:MAG: hypothetical protein SFV24_26485 [Gemmatimonadales bacterium]|nr:hypothetical protein [Gemmatimonadales bacterium]